jgi:hypothetical protein
MSFGSPLLTLLVSYEELLGSGGVADSSLSTPHLRCSARLSPSRRKFTVPIELMTDCQIRQRLVLAQYQRPSNPQLQHSPTWRHVQAQGWSQGQG